MNKKIKLSLLGTLIAGSALAVTLPIVSCSASTDAVAVTATVDAPKASTAMKTYLGTVNLATQQGTLKLGNIITMGALFNDLVAAVAFVETGTTTPALTDITVNLKEGYSSEAITINLTGLGNSATVPVTATVDAPNASTTMKTYLGTVDLVTQQGTLELGNIITTGALFNDLVAAVTFVETGTTTATIIDIIASFEVTTGATFEAGALISDVTLTVNLKAGYPSDTPITIVLTGLGNAAAAKVA